MKNTKIIAALGLIVIASFSSCKKNYTCTCTTVVATSSTIETHNIDNATLNDAKNECNNYQTQANNTLPGGTTCHL